MFKKNGGKNGGYLLKPKYMWQEGIFTKNYIKMYSIDLICLTIIHKKVLKQNNNMKFNIVLWGHPTDVKRNPKIKFKVSSNFIYPKIENNWSLLYFSVLYPELAFFIFKLKDGKNVIS